MAINIRAAVREDLYKILKLYQEPGFDDEKILDLATAESVFDKMKDYPRYTLYVVESQEKVIATFALLIMDNLAHLGAPSGIMEDISVHRDWRRKGIGKQMIEYALDQCRLIGCYKLSLSSNVKRDEAHRFYDALGFKRYGICFIVPLENELIR